MGRRKTGEHRVRFDQCGCRDNHLNPRGEPILDLICRGLMMLMPGAYRRNQAARVGKKGERHA